MELAAILLLARQMNDCKSTNIYYAAMINRCVKIRKCFLVGRSQGLVDAHLAMGRGALNLQ